MSERCSLAFVYCSAFLLCTLVSGQVPTGWDTQGSLAETLDKFYPGFFSDPTAWIRFSTQQVWHADFNTSVPSFPNFQFLNGARFKFGFCERADVGKCMYYGALHCRDRLPRGRFANPMLVEGLGPTNLGQEIRWRALSFAALPRNALSCCRILLSNLNPWLPSQVCTSYPLTTACLYRQLEQRPTKGNTRTLVARRRLRNS